jgi:hypothetical protein
MRIARLACVLLLALAAGAFAEQEQPLAYRTSASTIEGEEDYVGITSGQKLATQDKPPDGVALPKFTGEKPLFGLWKISMGKLTGPAARDKGLWLALDCSDKAGRYDLLYVDANGNGSLADEKPIRAERARNADGFVLSDFSMIRILLPGQDGPITRHISLLFRRPPGSPDMLLARCRGWYEGTITIAGRKFTCCVVDNNANGRFGDQSQEMDQCDRYIILPATGGKSPRPTMEQLCMFVGRYAQVDGEYYSMEVAPGGDTVEFTLAKVSTGTIKPGEGVSSMWVRGLVGTFEVEARNGVVEVPEGEYVHYFCNVTRKDEKGNTWRALGVVKSNDKPLVVRAGSETKIDVGEPFIYALSVSSAEQGLYRITQSLLTPRGDAIHLTCNDDALRKPKLRITNADKTYDHTFTMEYG